MAYLPQPSPGKVQVSARGLLRFLDEGVQDQNDVAHSGAKKRPAYPFFAFGPQLEQAIPHGAGKRHPKMGTEQLHTLGDPRVHGTNAHRPRLNRSPDRFTVILDLPWHVGSLTILLNPAFEDTSHTSHKNNHKFFRNRL